MGEITKTTTRWQCDACDLVEEFDGGLEPGGQEHWRKLKTVQPTTREGTYELETGQDWLLCRPCYQLATQRLGDLKAEHPELVELRRIAAEIRSGGASYPWIWQGDDHDHLASLGHSTVVQITAAQLRELLDCQPEERGEEGDRHG